MARPFIKNLFIQVAIKFFLIFVIFALIGTALGVFIDNKLDIKPFGSILAVIIVNIPAWYMVWQVRNDSIRIIKEDRKNDTSNTKK